MNEPSEPFLSHLDDSGRARMVDVGDKATSERRARARARVRMSPVAARAVAVGDGPKGEVLGVARLAGIQAAKRTAELIPLAHPLALTFVDVSTSVDVEAGVVELLGEAHTHAPTGVEMEAMTACAVAALTVYDMVKGLERDVTIEQVVLLEKHGGRSDYVRDVRDNDESGELVHGEGAGHAEAAAPERERPRAAILTVSTSKAAGRGQDESGVRLAALAERLGAEVVERELVPDEQAVIEQCLRCWADEQRCALILTTGGTGMSPSDVTPEATEAVIEREVPGLAEAMRAASRPYTRQWMLSRGLAGTRGGTLIVNFPGSPASIDQCGQALQEALPHALELIAGRGGH